MKGAWKMEEQSSVYIDCTINGNNGTLTSGGSTNRAGAGKYGTYAIDFTQSNDAYVNFGSASSLDNLSQISTGAWIYPDTDGDNNGNVCSAASIIGKNSFGDGWFFCMATPDRLKFAQKFSFGIGALQTGSVITYTGYQHVAVTYDNTSTSNTPHIYRNGVAQVGTITNTPFGTVNPDASFNLGLGIEIDQNVGEFDGRIDEPFVYSGIMNSTQINEIMNGALGGTGVPTHTIGSAVFGSMVIQ